MKWVGENTHLFLFPQKLKFSSPKIFVKKIKRRKFVWLYKYIYIYIYIYIYYVIKVGLRRRDCAK